MAIISLLKKLNEVTPSWLKRPFAPIIRKQLIGNKVFLSQYSELLEVDKLNEECIIKIQTNRLKGILVYAYENSKYYRRVMNEKGIDPYHEDAFIALKKMPLLTKEMLKSNLSEITSDAISDFYEVTTGGTTGEPTKVYMAKEAIYKEWAFIYHYWSKYGYDYKNSRLATFRGVKMGNKISEVNPLYSEIRMNVFLMNKDNIKKYHRDITRYKATYIYGYPSAIYNFCRLCKEACIDIHGKFRGALLISENLYSFQEKYIQDVIGSPVVIFYGHSERAVFAERTNEFYHFNPLYGYIEIGKNNEPIATGFINKKTPLLRYLVDDRVEKGVNGFYINGHWDDDTLIGRNNERISMAALNMHDSTFKNVITYQFMQDEIGKCLLYVTSDKLLSDDELLAISKSVNKKFRNVIKCTVLQRDKIQLTNRGKYKMLIQNCRVTFQKTDMGGGKANLIIFVVYAQCEAMLTAYRETVTA